MPGIRQVLNPDPVRVKVPIILQEQIKDSHDPGVSAQE